MTEALQLQLIINKTYKQVKNLDNRFVILYGGAGSGKSHYIAQHIFLSLIQTKLNWLILRKVSTTIKDSVFALLCDIIQSEDALNLFQINKTDKTIKCIHGGKVIMKGLDDPEKVKSVHGINKVWIEEASEFSEYDFNQLNLRLRGPGEKKQYFISFNPIDENHWLKKRFFDIKIDDVFIIHTTYKDNTFLDVEYIKELEKLKDIDNYFYDVYCLGKWGKISNARVFHNYIIEPFEIDGLKNVCYGMDFGFNHASTLIGCGYRDGELYIFEEFFFKELTNTEFIQQIEMSAFSKNQMITADNSEPDRIKQWRQAGFSITASKKGKGSLRNGIDYLKSLKIHIHSNCVNTIKEIQSFKYRELKDGTITEDFVEINDDCIAAIRYATEYIWSKGGIPVPRIKQLSNKTRSKALNLPT